jgi:hypothetical protein
MRTIAIEIIYNKPRADKAFLNGVLEANGGRAPSMWVLMGCQPANLENTLI